MPALHFLEGREVQPWRMHALLLLFAACGAALFGCTWRLWTPQLVYPQVPFFAWAGRVPASVEWGGLVAIFASLALVLVVSSIQVVRGAGSAGASPSQRTSPSHAASPLQAAALIVFAAATVLLILIDQHRLQPWAYQFAVIAIVLAAVPPRRAFVLLRWITVSIYVWSAIAKIDFTFLHTLGQQLTSALAGLAGIAIDNWSPTSRLTCAWTFPIIELIVAAGLCVPLDARPLLRRCVLGLLVAMHVALLLALGPLGLGHQPAVLVWNVWFIAQGLLLFGFPPSPAASDETTGAADRQLSWRRELADVVVELLVAAVIFLPALNFFDRFDHWPAWGLYAPRNSRALVFVPAHVDTGSSPVSMVSTDADPSTDRDRGAEVAQAVSFHNDWKQIRLDLWSLQSLAVPIYPQDRFQLAVADATIRQRRWEDSFQIVLESPADRRTGQRRRQVIRTLAELRAAQQRYLLNARARTQVANAR
jgi:hypothetical protein